MFFALGHFELIQFPVHSFSKKGNDITSVVTSKQTLKIPFIHQVPGGPPNATLKKPLLRIDREYTSGDEYFYPLS